MKKAPYIIVCIIALCTVFCPKWAFAVKAVANIVKYRQSDGSVLYLKICGDEFLGYSRVVGGTLTVGSAGNTFLLSSNILQKSIIEGLRERGKMHLLQGGGAVAVKSGTGFHFSRALEHRTGVEPAKVEALVLLVEFSDIQFTMEDPIDYFNSMLNGGAFYTNGATGSAASYLNENFAGKCSFSFDVEGIIRLEKRREYYGARNGFQNDVNPGTMVEEACMEALKAGVDFSKYDLDKDGTIDNVAIIFAGHNEAESGEPDAIWPHYGNVSNKNIELGAVKLGGYTCSSEFTGGNTQEQPATIGTFLHEFCHFLGLPDMYDVNSSEEGESDSLFGKLSIMDAGNYLNGGNTPPYFNSIEREILMISSVEELAPLNSYTLPSVDKSSVIYKIKSNMEGEYFLVECRNTEGWDSYIGGRGLVVYHIDKSERIVGGISAAARWSLNIINSYALHQCARVLAPPIPVDCIEPIEFVFYPGATGTTVLNSKGIPKLLDWNMSGVGVSLDNISFSNGTVTFSTLEDISYVDSMPQVTSLQIEPHQSSLLLQWSHSEENNEEKTDGENGKWKVSISQAQDGKLSFEAITEENHIIAYGLKPGMQYTVNLYSVNGLSMGKVFTSQFSTDKITSRFPFIKVNETYKVGSILYMPVHNLPGSDIYAAMKVNGEVVSGEYMLLENEGEYNIELSITLPDNSIEVITKTIIVKK